MLRQRKKSPNIAQYNEQRLTDRLSNGDDGTKSLPIPRQRPPFRSRTRSNPPASPSQSSSTLPLVLTFFIPLASYITGGDLLKEIVLLLLLIFYLHQLIQVPWELYLAARSRHHHSVIQSPLGSPSSEVPDTSSSLSPHPRPTATQSHLHVLELIYLSLSVLSPLFGSLLLRLVSSSFGISSLSWFSTTLFAFIAGLRPWNHLVERLRGHTELLHDTISGELGVDDFDSLEYDEGVLEKERQEWREKLSSFEQGLEEMRTATALLERRVWKLERNSARDRSKLEHVEAKLAELLLSLERRPLSTAAFRSLKKSNSRLPNPFFQPLIFLTMLFWISLTPLFYVFPFLSSYHPQSSQFPSTFSNSSSTQRSRFRLHPKANPRLETVLETEESETPTEDEGSMLVNPEITPGVDRDTSSPELDSDTHTDLARGTLAESELSILNIAVYTPAKAAYAFVTGILKHGL